MKYEEINYGLSVNQLTGESWKKIDLRVSLNDTDDKDECFRKAERQVQEWSSQKENFSANGIVSPNPNDFSPPPIIQVEKTTEDSIIEAISSATTLKTLQWLKPRGENEKNEAIMNAYIQKFNSLNQ